MIHVKSVFLGFDVRKQFCFSWHLDACLYMWYRTTPPQYVVLRLSLFADGFISLTGQWLEQFRISWHLCMSIHAVLYGALAVVLRFSRYTDGFISLTGQRSAVTAAE